MPLPVATTLLSQQVLAGGANVFAVTAGTTPFEKERSCCRDMARGGGAAVPPDRNTSQLYRPPTGAKVPGNATAPRLGGIGAPIRGRQSPGWASWRPATLILVAVSATQAYDRTT